VPEVPQPVRMDSQALIVTLVDGVLTIRLDRPETRNALTDEMPAGLRRALDGRRARSEGRSPRFTGR
jgi:enoyl-CoA hydratase/carnithine racemase